uniref:Cytoplasmic dynein 1 intermediate chain 2 n=1 Tax=Sphaerodactylus townsendi TaxID=933632 RepID=A0ACB8G136_9SAUR
MVVPSTCVIRTLHWDTDPSVLQLHSDSDLGRGPIKLAMSKITQVDFPPRETVSYTKETQTPVLTQPKEGEYLFDFYS